MINSTSPSPNKGGRPAQMVPCGWCREGFKTRDLPKHLAVCLLRPPKEVVRKRRSRRKSGWRQMLRYFRAEGLRLEEVKSRGGTLEEFRSSFTFLWEKLWWAAGDEWSRLPDALVRESQEAQEQVMEEPDPPNSP